MKLKSFVFGLCVILFSATSLNAQVRIGSDDPPDNFAILQIDGQNSGMRLYRMNNVEKAGLAVNGDSDAKGLLIYNDDTDQLEYWDGTKWVMFVAPSYTFINGLTFASNDVELGGDLIENTEIGQNGNALTLNTGTTANFTVNTDLFSANNNQVSLTNSSLLVNQDVLKVEGNNITVNADTMTVNNNVLKVGSNKVEINGGLTYPGHGAATDKILYSDTNGNAFWDVIPPTIDIIKPPVTLANNGGISTTSSSWTNATAPFTLTAGTWIVLGVVGTYTSVRTDFNNNNNSYNNHLTLVRVRSENTGNTVHYQTGSLPERKSSGGAVSTYGGSFCTPVLTGVIELSTDDTVRVQLFTNKASTTLTNTFVSPFFQFVKYK